MGAENQLPAAPEPRSDDIPTEDARAEIVKNLAPQIARQLLQALPSEQVQIELLGKQYVIVDRATVPPPAPTPSIPVRAARGTYKLTRLGFALLGVLVAVAEALSSNHAVLREVLKALVQAADQPVQSPSSAAVDNHRKE